jgi:hypothetical protein
MKRLATAVAIGSLVACGGGSGPGSLTAPTPPVANANIGGSDASIAGSYNGTITASSNCSANLPPEGRVLGFGATITQTGAAVQMQLSAGADPVTVSGTVSGQTVNFPGFSFSGLGRAAGVALVATVTLAATGGNANVAADGAIAGTLSGTYETPSASCSAANHQLQMVKSSPGSPRR